MDNQAGLVILDGQEYLDKAVLQGILVYLDTLVKAVTQVYRDIAVGLDIPVLAVLVVYLDGQVILAFQDIPDKAAYLVIVESLDTPVSVGSQGLQGGLDIQDGPDTLVLVVNLV